MVPENHVELVYRLPDAIACMDEDEIESSCKYTNDYVVCDDEYFYLRCTLPLPVNDTDEDYSIGVWAQISSNSFNKVWELWSDENQINEPPIAGLLANCVHLNTGVEDAEITVQLTGPKTRPVITIQDINCSLYNEQQSGITIHRASEYSDLYR
jgi:hypothetical protein